MKATLNSIKNPKGFNVNHRYENRVHENYMVINPFTQSVDIELRVYYPNNGSGRVTAAFWINSSAANIYISGTGWAGGYGYDRASAAAQEAIKNAGIELSECIAAKGSDAIERGLIAIAEAVGLKGTFIIRAHA